LANSRALHGSGLGRDFEYNESFKEVQHEKDIMLAMALYLVTEQSSVKWMLWTKRFVYTVVKRNKNLKFKSAPHPCGANPTLSQDFYKSNSFKIVFINHRRFQMKKSILFGGMLALALVFGMVLTGCSKKDGGGSAAKSSGGGGKANPASDFSYDLSEDGNGIVITKYTGTGKGVKVVVPTKIEDMPVVEIKRISGGYVGAITAITIPNTVTKIGTLSFNGPKFDMPDSVTEIGQRAFHDCSELTEVRLSNNLKYIPWAAFEDCKKLTTVNLPTSLEAIGGMSFWGCVELNNLIIPESLTSIKFVHGQFDPTQPDDSQFSFGGEKLPIKTRQRLQALGYTGKFGAL
jgi:hypothetical protein